MSSKLVEQVHRVIYGDNEESSNARPANSSQNSSEPRYPERIPGSYLSASDTESIDVSPRLEPGELLRKPVVDQETQESPTAGDTSMGRRKSGSGDVLRKPVVDQPYDRSDEYENRPKERSTGLNVAQGAAVGAATGAVAGGTTGAATGAVTGGTRATTGAAFGSGQGIPKDAQHSSGRDNFADTTARQPQRDTGYNSMTGAAFGTSQGIPKGAQHTTAEDDFAHTRDKSSHLDARNKDAGIDQGSHHRQPQGLNAHDERMAKSAADRAVDASYNTGFHQDKQPHRGNSYNADSGIDDSMRNQMANISVATNPAQTMDKDQVGSQYNAESFNPDFESSSPTSGRGIGHDESKWFDSHSELDPRSTGYKIPDQVANQPSGVGRGQDPGMTNSTILGTASVPKDSNVGSPEQQWEQVPAANWGTDAGLGPRADVNPASTHARDKPAAPLGSTAWGPKDNYHSQSRASTNPETGSASAAQVAQTHAKLYPAHIGAAAPAVPQEIITPSQREILGTDEAERPPAIDNAPARPPSGSRYPDNAKMTSDTQYNQVGPNQPMPTADQSDTTGVPHLVVEPASEPAGNMSPDYVDPDSNPAAMGPRFTADTNAPANSGSRPGYHQRKSSRGSMESHERRRSVMDAVKGIFTTKSRDEEYTAGDRRPSSSSAVSMDSTGEESAAVTDKKLKRRLELPTTPFGRRMSDVIPRRPKENIIFDPVSGKNIATTESNDPDKVAEAVDRDLPESVRRTLSKPSQFFIRQQEEQAQKWRQEADAEQRAHQEQAEAAHPHRQERRKSLKELFHHKTRTHKIAG